MSGGCPRRIYGVVGTLTRCYPPLTWWTSCLLTGGVVVTVTVDIDNPDSMALI